MRVVPSALAGYTADRELSRRLSGDPGTLHVPDKPRASAATSCHWPGNAQRSHI